MKNKKGFTLMEILAVLLLIAVVVSMAVPIFRSVRFDIKNAQAKSAAKKMAEAMRSYYQTTRGGTLNGCIAGSSVRAALTETCAAPAATGIPRKSLPPETNVQDVKQLFTCGNLPVKDFESLPYNFCACFWEESTNCPDTAGDVYVSVTGNAEAGEKYNTSSAAKTEDGEVYRIRVDKDMRIVDNAK